MPISGLKQTIRDHAYSELSTDSYWYKRFKRADKRAKKWRKEVKQQKALIAYSEWLSKRRLNYWTDADLYRSGWKFLTMILLGVITILLLI